MTVSKFIDRTKMPNTGNRIALDLSNPELIKLDNGIEAYVINQDDAEFTRIDIVFDAGSSVQTKNLVAESTLQLLIDGTSSLSSEDIARELDYHGAIIDTSLTKDKAILSLYSLEKHLTGLLPIISDMVVNATFNEKELDNYIHRKRHQFLINSDKVRYKAMLEFNKLVFGSGSAYGRTKTLSDYDKLTRDDLLDNYNLRYSPVNTYIVFSGKVNSKSIAMMNKYLGDGNWGKTETKIINSIHIDDVDRVEKYLEKDGSLQSAIRIGQPIINKLHPDYNGLVVLNTILGGYFGSRLMSNLRENKGYTYGISSYIINYLHGGFWSITTEVNADHTKNALKEIEFELNLLREKPVPDDEIKLVKNYIYGTYLRSFDGPIALSERFRSARDLNLDFGFYKESLEKMMHQTPSQLLELANKYFDFKDMIILVVGKLINEHK
jgi:zinc protease